MDEAEKITFEKGLVVGYNICIYRKTEFYNRKEKIKSL